MNKSSSNKNKFHIYLIQPKGRLIKPIDLDTRTLEKYEKSFASPHCSERSCYLS